MSIRGQRQFEDDLWTVLPASDGGTWATLTTRERLSLRYRWESRRAHFVRHLSRSDAVALRDLLDDAINRMEDPS